VPDKRQDLGDAQQFARMRAFIDNGHLMGRFIAGDKCRVQGINP
jgi:hypothetical protein